jgi:hypothetical protein
MVTPPTASTPWLQPLVAGLRDVQSATKRTKKLKAAASGVDVPPRFVSPVWESVVPDEQLEDAVTQGSKRNDSVVEGRKHLHLADAALFTGAQSEGPGGSDCKPSLQASPVRC